MRKRDLPPLNWLKTFEAAARLLNFSAAARELNMTQSAVSQQIRLLEDYLGQPLFKRLARRLSLTTSGKAYFSYVREALAHLRKGTTELFSPLKEGTLTIECSTTIGVVWLSAQLKHFCRQYPRLSIRMVNANWDNVDTVDSYFLTYQENRPLSKAALVFRDWLLTSLRAD
jgi:LysR family glycine cleavage system transcriptional activator